MFYTVLHLHVTLTWEKITFIWRLLLLILNIITCRNCMQNHWYKYYDNTESNSCLFFFSQTSPSERDKSSIRSRGPSWIFWSTEEWGPAVIKDLGDESRSGKATRFPGGGPDNSSTRYSIVGPQDKKIVLIELTVPWEERCGEAYERKEAKYTQLTEECRKKGWTAWLLPVDVGTRPSQCGRCWLS